MKLPFLLLAFCSAYSIHCAAASFDCSKAATGVEKTICSDKTLSELDETLARAYRDSMNHSSSPNDVKAKQKSWLTGVRNACSDAACLQRAYSDRISALGGNPSPQVEPPPPTSLTGTYKTKNGELKILQLSKERIKFEISATYGQNMGESSGEAPIKGNDALYVNRESDCGLIFNFQSDVVQLTQDGTCSMGLNVSATGTYRLVDSKAPQFEDQMSAPGVASKAQEPQKAAPIKNENPNLVAKHAQEISSLGFSKKFLKSIIYLQGNLVSRPQKFMPFEQWVALLFENQSIAKITAIQSGDSEGILLKSPGMPSLGFLFREDGGDLFPTHLAKGDEAVRIESMRDAYTVAMLIIKTTLDSAANAAGAHAQ